MTVKLEHDFSSFQDVLGQMSWLRVYIQLCLVFEVNDGPREDLEYVLEDACGRMADAFPFLTGRVVVSNRTKTSTGTVQILPHRQLVPLAIKDLRNDGFPSFESLKEQKYPFKWLQPSMLEPPTVSTYAKQMIMQTWDDSDVAPVFAVQANLIDGAILLCLVGHHSLMDMTGLGILVSLFAKALRKEPFTQQELDDTNRARGQIIPLLEPSELQAAELEDVMLPPSDGSSFSFGGPLPLTVHITFPAASVARLKAEASQQTLVPFISTDDAITAFVWQQVVRARSKRLGPRTVYQVTRACSLRRAFGVPTYTGHFIDNITIEEVDPHELPLSYIAAKLRAALSDEKKNIRHVRALATLIAHSEDNSRILPGAKLHLDKDLVVSSHTNSDCCSWDYGPLGRPVTARRLLGPSIAGLSYILPKSSDGSLGIGITLSEEDLAVLKNETILSEYAGCDW
ncbi:hypothetical protein CAC42_628 [Sphaceloma murrayae]|uniref:Trichothecene 3-O-acetyltransferase-like N-terminal domain-containing protein n=1 Tax=Sphaceloma murrayae TaxID=2082308 RepID=A0A2K1QKF9_9PEZI|nr:hypothetical protein CAC42_628 [Sphaceloma murrayae]